MATCNDRTDYKWTQLRWHLSNSLLHVEPSVAIYRRRVGGEWRERVVLLCRSNTEQETLYVLVAKEDGPILPTSEFPFWVKRTNLEKPAVDNGWFNDTNDISFNVIRGHCELVVGDRGANSQISSDEPEERMRILLYSLPIVDVMRANESPLDFKAQCTLFTRAHRYGGGAPSFDGFHTGGGIIDGELQRLFIYSGYKQYGAGLFQIVRTRNIQRLRSALGNPH